MAVVAGSGKSATAKLALAAMDRGGSFSRKERREGALKVRELLERESIA